MIPPEGQFLEALGIDPTTAVLDSSYLVHIGEKKTIVYYTGIKMIDRESVDTALEASGFTPEVRPLHDAL